MTYDIKSFMAGLRAGLALPRVAKPKPPAHYLTFKSEDSSEFTLSVYNRTRNWDGTLYYSTDAATWTVWDGTTTLSSNGGVLHLRGSGNSKITGSNGANFRWVLPSNKRIRCAGNIEYLLDWETVKAGQHPQMAASCYRGMFYECRKLTAAPELPATVLTESCYYDMFRYCTSLTTAPELPATILATECYLQMFGDCTSLMTAPTLPATILADRCYYNLFYHCTSLTEAPELPATILANNCYFQMFFGCTSLTTAPELPATTLAEYCYASMFMSCTSLTESPALPATILAEGCYWCMFFGCTSLATAPEIPATTLEKRCCYEMFYNCRNLKLSETQDATYQYPYRIPASGTGVTASYALYEMFVNTGGTFTGPVSINTTYYTDHPPVPAT